MKIEISRKIEDKTPLEIIYADIQEIRNKPVEEKYEENDKIKIRYRRGSRRREFNNDQNPQCKSKSRINPWGSWFKKYFGHFPYNDTYINNPYTSNYTINKKQYYTKTNYTSQSIYL
jgi:hypothetical protein